MERGLDYSRVNAVEFIRDLQNLWDKSSVSTSSLGQKKATDISFNPEISKPQRETDLSSKYKLEVIQL